MADLELRNLHLPRRYTAILSDPTGIRPEVNLRARFRFPQDAQRYAETYLRLERMENRYNITVTEE